MQTDPAQRKHLGRDLQIHAGVLLPNGLSGHKLLPVQCMRRMGIKGPQKPAMVI